MDPDFVSPKYKMYDMNLPVVTTPSKVSSLGSGSEGMVWAPIVAGGLQALGGYFQGRRQSKEAEANRQLQRDQLALQRQRFGLESQQYQDELAQMRARSAYMDPYRQRFAERGGIGDIGKFDISQFARKPSTPESRASGRAELEGILSGVRQRRMEQG